MKIKSNPQLMSMIEESNGKLTLPYFTLKNIYFKGDNSWDDLVAWADFHNITVFPNRVPQSLDDPVRLSL